MLMDGDPCLMDGAFQKYYQHRIPKEPWVEGSRVNLTWRWIRKHTQGCICGQEPADTNPCPE